MLIITNNQSFQIKFQELEQLLQLPVYIIPYDGYDYFRIEKQSRHCLYQTMHCILANISSLESGFHSDCNDDFDRCDRLDRTAIDHEL